MGVVRSGSEHWCGCPGSRTDGLPVRSSSLAALLLAPSSVSGDVVNEAGARAPTLRPTGSVDEQVLAAQAGRRVNVAE